MKKFLSLVAVFPLLFAAACTSQKPKDPVDPDKGEKTAITLWTYPVGGWGNASPVAEFLSAFESKYPEIRVSVEYVSYTTGDPKNGDALVKAAIEEGGLPDLILEGPKRLVADWGARGVMAPLNDLWESEAAGRIDANVKAACRGAEGDYYIAPICMTTHCMAINREVFEAAGALQYVHEDTHTWSAEEFENAVAAVKTYYDGLEAQGEKHRDVAAVYCKGQGGDQGTRALVNNLCGGTFADTAHTEYTVNSEENIEALTLLKGMEGIRFDAEMEGADECSAFCAGDLAMSFCWNVAIESSQIDKNPNLFDILPMAFPSKAGETPKLQGGIWGFGAFDNGDEARLTAAKTFIRYATEEGYARAVTLSSYLPVRKLVPDPYENDRLMTEYSIFSDYFGDFYQVTPEWAQARAAWYALLQEVGGGADIRAAAAKFPATFEAAREA